MKIGITSDHGGYKLKNKIINHYKDIYELKDYGTNSEESVDYPDYAFILGNSIINKEVDYGIAICKTGIGMSIALNKIKGVYCAKVDNKNDSYCSKNHNGVNAISLSGNMPFRKAKIIIDSFFKETNIIEERHQRRINKIRKYEDEH